MPISSALVCFIVCHAAPADHFATFIDQLSKENKAIIEVYASGPALKKFQERGIRVKRAFSLEGISVKEEDVLAEQIAQSCCKASVVMTDVGHPFDIKLQKALRHRCIDVLRLAYYDNPEPYVPGGYSAVANEVMQVAQRILFANSNLAQNPLFKEPGQEIDFKNAEKIGIGYYPIHQAEKIGKQRLEQQSLMREVFFLKNNLADTAQKILVYFGGNNEEYFSKAFPAFLSLLEGTNERVDLSNLVILFHQHPGAKEKNLDVEQMHQWMNQKKKMPKIFLSNFTLEEVQILTDGILYYQTSMGPQFVLAGIPLIQIGHVTFEDILIKNQLASSVTNVEQFVKAIEDLATVKRIVPQEVILKGLGIKDNWFELLENAFVSKTLMPL